ncbi:hypothetical protein CPB84DRAFT_1548045 [Gymnopilus junonius]|uniref:Uncharacterized protein n=1 Tax=Gymnopilus junonius TaxID=109634 RepID=A0A9P5NGG7_GYMJU|nr:hypothetical protein CPB84DRAFT_1548045 [Gymnopilus junonius]
MMTMMIPNVFAACTCFSLCNTFFLLVDCFHLVYYSLCATSFHSISFPLWSSVIVLIISCKDPNHISALAITLYHQSFNYSHYAPPTLHDIYYSLPILQFPHFSSIHLWTITHTHIVR